MTHQSHFQVLNIAELPGCISLQGYLFISVLVSANSELIKLIIQSIKNDLSSRNPINVCLALQCIANIGNQEMVEAVGQEVPKLLVSPDTTDNVKQCTALCVLKLFRLKADILPPGEWTSRIVQLLNDKHLVCTCCVLLREDMYLNSIISTRFS